MRKFTSRFWMLVVLTGISAGIGGGLLMKLLYFIQKISWPQGPGDFQDAVQRATTWRHIGVMLAAGLLAGFGRRLIRYATGGHAGELAQTIWFQAGKLPAIATLVCAVLSIVIVGMGAALGREGALKQTGAAIAAKLSEWGDLHPPQRRLLAACGAGAGIAAAYNVPFGAAVFAVEVLLGTLSLPLVLPALACSLLGTAVSWLFLPTHATYAVPQYALGLGQIGWAVVAGPLFGLTSVAYVRLIAWADRRKPRGPWVMLSPVLVFTLLGAASITFPALLGNGKDLVQRAFTAKVPLGLLAVLAVLRPLATASCLGSGAPGGLFTPTITLGALLGGALGCLWGIILPGGTPGSYAFLGAGAILAATTQGPISSIVLMMELTRRTDAEMVPLLLVVAIATAVARRLEGRSIYSARIKEDEARALQPYAGARTKFSKLLSSDFVLLPSSTRYGPLVRQLFDAIQRAAPVYVVDAQGKLMGQVTPEAAQDSGRSALPLDTETAADLARATPVVTSAMSEDEVLERLCELDVKEAPVIEHESGRLMGMVKSPQHNTEKMAAAKPINIGKLTQPAPAARGQ
jgi:H+/Cl- antiporter ClcA